MITKTRVRGFDFHCHVDLFPDPEAMIAACERDRIVTLAVTTTPRAWTQNRRWTEGSLYLHAALGLHPELVGERHSEIAMLEQLAAETPFIGEIGLDGSPPHFQTLGLQKDVFIRALSAAQRLGGRVLSIHSRRASADVLACIEEHTTSDRVLPILHWFSDSITIARQAIGLGCSFSVNVRMLEHQSGVTLVRSLPADRLLTETDAPFTSVGKSRNEPQGTGALAERLATARGCSVDEIRQTLAENAGRVFAFAGIEAQFVPVR